MFSIVVAPVEGGWLFCRDVELQARNLHGETFESSVDPTPKVATVLNYPSPNPMSAEGYDAPARSLTRKICHHEVRPPQPTSGRALRLPVGPFPHESEAPFPCENKVPFPCESKAEPIGSLSLKPADPKVEVGTEPSLYDSPLLIDFCSPL